MSVRLNVNLPATAKRDLDELMLRLDMNQTSAVVRALKIFEVLTRHDVARVVTVNREGIEREVIL